MSARSRRSICSPLPVSGLALAARDLYGMLTPIDKVVSLLSSVMTCGDATTSTSPRVATAWTRAPNDGTLSPSKVEVSDAPRTPATAPAPAPARLVAGSIDDTEPVCRPPRVTVPSSPADAACQLTPRARLAVADTSSTMASTQIRRRGRSSSSTIARTAAASVGLAWIRTALVPGSAARRIVASPLPSPPVTRGVSAVTTSVALALRRRTAVKAVSPVSRSRTATRAATR